ncbi:MAG: hypothetical protein ACJAU4_001455 [Glaciecola sp.]|jgi:hypothetical protein
MSSLKSITDAMEKLICTKHTVNQYLHKKRVMRLFSTRQTCALLQKSTTSLYKCEELGVIAPQVRGKNGRRVGYLYVSEREY